MMPPGRVQVQEVPRSAQSSRNENTVLAVRQSLSWRPADPPKETDLFDRFAEVAGFAEHLRYQSIL